MYALPLTFRLRVLAAGSIAAALVMGASAPLVHAAETATTASCVDGGGITWRTKVVWGGRYTASDGVQRVSVGVAGWTTNARTMATDSTVKTYSRTGSLLQTLNRSASFNYASGAAYDSRNPSNPPSGAAKITISAGKDNDGFGKCRTTHIQPTASTETGLTAYVTGYTYYDNTPPGSAAISNPILHSQAGGTGTYDDPITVAVGHSTASGQDVLDYPAGTRFYMQYLKRYFIVEDTCGDGDYPETGPCHVHPSNVTAWLDIWVDGQGGSQSSATSCAERITGNQPVIINPERGLTVTAGPVSKNGRCAI